MPGDHQSDIEAAEQQEAYVNSVLKCLLELDQAVDIAIRAEIKFRGQVVARVDVYKTALKKAAALLYAAKEDLIGKDGELAR